MYRFISEWPGVKIWRNITCMKEYKILDKKNTLSNTGRTAVGNVHFHRRNIKKLEKNIADAWSFPDPSIVNYISNGTA